MELDVSSAQEMRQTEDDPTKRTGCGTGRKWDVVKGRMWCGGGRVQGVSVNRADVLVK